MLTQYKILLYSNLPDDISFFKKNTLDISLKYNVVIKLYIFSDINRLIKNIYFEHEKYDIYFINSNDKNISSVRLAELLRSSGIKKSIVYLLDNFSEDICGFKNNIMDYLLRPMNPRILEQLLIYDYQNHYLKSQILLNKNSNYFYLKLADFVFIEVYNRGIKIHTSNLDSLMLLSTKADLANDINLNEKSIVYSEKISDFIHRLDSLTFIQCHQSFIININKLISIRRYSAVLDNGSKNGVTVDISKRNWEALKKRVQASEMTTHNVNSLLSADDLERIAGGDSNFDFAKLLK